MKKILRTISLLIVVAASVVSASAKTEREVPTKNVPGPAMVTIAVPAGYEQDSTRRYPTVYLLNGHGGDHKSWPSFTNIDSLATVHGIVIVCPAGQNSWYFDSPVDKNMQMESYITKDLVKWVDENYRTIRRPEQRAITGLSMGGHGAMWIALHHPDLFLNVGSTSGGVDFTPFPNRWGLPKVLGRYEQNKRLWADHTVISQVDSIPRGKYNIIFDCGTEDFFFKVNKRLHNELQRRGIVHEFLTSPGIHNTVYWGKAIVPQLNFFSNCFKKGNE